MSSLSVQQDRSAFLHSLVGWKVTLNSVSYQVTKVDKTLDASDCFDRVLMQIWSIGRFPLAGMTLTVVYIIGHDNPHTISYQWSYIVTVCLFETNVATYLSKIANFYHSTSCPQCIYRPQGVLVFGTVGGAAVRASDFRSQVVGSISARGVTI